MSIIDSSSSRFDVSAFTKLDITSKDMRQATDAERAEFKKIQEGAHITPVSHAKDRLQETYAEVVVDGKSVAKLYNGGYVETSNAMHGKISKLGSVENPRMTGPALAQQRAEEIAAALGGTVVKSASAMTQAEYMKIPVEAYALDYAALEKAETAKTVFTTQVLAQDSASEVTESSVAEKSVVYEFLEFAEKSYEEKMYDLMLKKLGLTEEDVANMTPEQRAEIEEKIKEMIKAEIEKDTGLQIT